MENLLAHLATKHRFTTMYKPNTNGLIERTNRTLSSMLVKNVEVHVNICDWDFEIHHVVWVLNITYKTATRYSPFCLTYGMEAFLPIELKVMILRIDTMMKLCRNPSFGLATKAKGVVRLRAKRKSGS